MNFRVGTGTDAHRLAPGRKLVLGGVHLRFEKGPVGHSDGDALSHAICDALLGAAALGDIGRHFPNTSSQYRNVSSLGFLRLVRDLITKKGWVIGNVDAVVELERPKVGPHALKIRKNIAAALGIRPAQVSVKAKTGEGMDAVGRGEAIRAQAVALIEKATAKKK